MQFLKYPHIERFGNSEVSDIEFGDCYVFPKIDGTNASLWIGDDGQLCAGSRNRELSLDNDNAGFMNWAIKDEKIKKHFEANPKTRLYGEWLVPHSLKTYRNDAWRKFYVFDVMYKDEFMSYDMYKSTLDYLGIDYIAPLAIIKNGTYEQFIDQLAKNVFLIEDGKGAGEGIVLKRYGYVNKFGRTTWAKIVTSEFKEKHAKEMGGSIIQGRKMIEEEICDKYITQALVDKEFAKINNECGWSSKLIPRLLNVVFYSLIKEDAWDFIKDHNFPQIDFKRLRFFANHFVKARKPELF
jgi:hypothetical protein